MPDDHSFESVWSPVVLAALACGLILRITFALLTPVGTAGTPGVLSSYNDELAHAKYALFVLQHGSLPPQVESIQADGALERGSYENYQPPLYYILIAGLSRLFGESSLEQLVRVGRLFGIAVFAGIVLLFRQISKAANLDHWQAQAGLLFIALNGVLVCFLSTVGNESLFYLLGGGMVLLSLRMEKEGLLFSHWMTFAALACLAIYTKLTAVLLLPLPLLALARRMTPRLAVSLAGMLCVVLVCVFPLWLRNFYGFGSLLPLNAGFGDPAWRIPGWHTFTFAIRSFIFPWSEFWHGFVGLLFFLPLCIFALRGMVFRTGWREIVSRPVFLAAILIAVGSFLWLNTRYDQAEGRYLFTAWPALPVLLFGRPRRNSDLWLLFATLILPYGLFLLPISGV